MGICDENFGKFPYYRINLFFLLLFLKNRGDEADSLILSKIEKMKKMLQTTNTSYVWKKKKKKKKIYERLRVQF